MVRHGQASFGAADYDQLSDLGGEQGRALGRWWQDRKFAVDAVYQGPRRRHRQTASACGETFSGLAPARAAPGLDEYPAFELLKRVGPLLADDPEVSVLLKGLQSGDGPATQKLIQVVTRRWALGELDVPGIETWSEFRGRVEREVERMLAAHGGGSQTVVAHTSAGPVSAAVGRALGLDDERTLALSWNLYNGSTTTFLFTQGRFTLSEFNVTAHLDTSQITYR
jgi:broad specificity phosphatase PhoE